MIRIAALLPDLPPDPRSREIDTSARGGVDRASEGTSEDVYPLPPNLEYVPGEDPGLEYEDQDDWEWDDE